MVSSGRFARLARIVAWTAVTAGAGDAWAELDVFVLHNPIQPGSAQTVTYEASAKETTGLVQQIEIWEETRQLQACANGQTQPPCYTTVTAARSVKTCVINPPAATPPPCQYMGGPYLSPVNYVTYRAIATNSQGATKTDGDIGFAVGPYPWTNDPIPIYVRSNTLDQNIDLVFIPDLDYGAAGSFETTFTNDVASLLKNAYLSTQPFSQEIRNRRGEWNFYLTYQQGNAEPNCQRTKPSNWTNMRITVDTGFIVHTTDFSDCSDLNQDLLWGTTFSAEPTSLVPAIHETGHGAFGLADEYSGGGLFENTMYPNIFSDKARCDANKCNAKTNCKKFAGNWSRCDGAADLMKDTSSPSNVFDECDAKRIQWVHGQCGTGSC